LLVYVDDATSRLMALHFAATVGLDAVDRWPTDYL
jgi:hypothetical protein